MAIKQKYIYRKLGREDIHVGTGKATVTLPNGQTVEINKLNMPRYIEYNGTPTPDMFDPPLYVGEAVAVKNTSTGEVILYVWDGNDFINVTTGTGTGGGGTTQPEDYYQAPEGFMARAWIYRRSGWLSNGVFTGANLAEKNYIFHILDDEVNNCIEIFKREATLPPTEPPFVWGKRYSLSNDIVNGIFVGEVLPNGLLISHYRHVVKPEYPTGNTTIGLLCIDAGSGDFVTQIILSDALRKEDYSHQRFQKFHKLSNGNLLLVSNRGLVAEFDINDLIFSQVYSLPTPTVQAPFLSPYDTYYLLATDNVNDKVLIARRNSDGTDPSPVQIIQIDWQNATVDWAIQINEINASFCGLYEATNDIWVIVGFDNSGKSYIVKIDKTGAIVTSKYYQKETTRFFSIIELGGYYYVCGDEFVTPRYGILLKINPNTLEVVRIKLYSDGSTSTFGGSLGEFGGELFMFVGINKYETKWDDILQGINPEMPIGQFNGDANTGYYWADTNIVSADVTLSINTSTVTLSSFTPSNTTFTPIAIEDISEISTFEQYYV